MRVARPLGKSVEHASQNPPWLVEFLPSPHQSRRQLIFFQSHLMCYRARHNGARKYSPGPTTGRVRGPNWAFRGLPPRPFDAGQAAEKPWCCPPFFLNPSPSFARFCQRPFKAVQAGVVEWKGDGTLQVEAMVSRMICLFKRLATLGRSRRDKTQRKHRGNLRGSLYPIVVNNVAKLNCCAAAVGKTSKKVGI